MHISVEGVQSAGEWWVNTDTRRHHQQTKVFADTLIFHCYVGALVAGKNSRDIAVCFFHVATALTAFKYGMCSDQQGIQRCLAQRLEK